VLKYFITLYNRVILNPYPTIKINELSISICKEYKKKKKKDHHTKELFGENDDSKKPKLIPKPLCKKSHIYTHKDDELENSNQCKL